jgi:hypothetical protein
MSVFALNLLIEEAAAHHATLIHRSEVASLFLVDPPLASGGPTRPFRILLGTRGNEPYAREETPDLLPAFCSERHINPDGTFCLYWNEADRIEIVDRGTSARWWRTLLRFLQRQRAANVLRRWPGSADDRAHGPDAARHQARAEAAASSLGQKFVQDLRDGRFATIRRKRGSEVRVRLLLNGQKIAAVLETSPHGSPRVMTLRARCRCGAKRTLRSCGTHAQDLAALTIALHSWRLSEAKFYDEIAAKGHRCCGSLNFCPLASKTAFIAQAAS